MKSLFEKWINSRIFYQFIYQSIMGQSLAQNYVHIVFSTKHRVPLITPEIEAELYSYIAGVCKALESPCIKVGGHFDHVHILCNLSKNISLASLLNKVKSNSSKWIKTKGTYYKNFSWQRGYGAFSVSNRHLDIIARYIENQKDHHKNHSFKEEYLEDLKRRNVDFNEMYLWD